MNSHGHGYNYNLGKPIIGPVPLGKKGRQVDLQWWNVRCLAALGRLVNLGDKLSPTEMYRLGFIHAAYAAAFPGRNLPDPYRVQLDQKTGTQS